MGGWTSVKPKHRLQNVKQAEFKAICLMFYELNREAAIRMPRLLNQVGNKVQRFWVSLTQPELASVPPSMARVVPVM